ncbi:hypothetical protein E2C01_090472 [Portunus trituberculatus]|uniref:Uncharacterized protein n=1 Tax=Portunus trituberculatus TaxID=210409 RepID=A0A5B7JET1_PORTR|nr:hypothetical protein [Portunus trituberculatus]
MLADTQEAEECVPFLTPLPRSCLRFPKPRLSASQSLTPFCVALQSLTRAGITMTHFQFPLLRVGRHKCEV